MFQGQHLHGHLAYNIPSTLHMRTSDKVNAANVQVQAELICSATQEGGKAIV